MMESNDVRVTIIAVLGMFLVFAIIFITSDFFTIKKLRKEANDLIVKNHLLNNEKETLLEERTMLEERLTKEVKNNSPRIIEKFVVEPVILKSKTSFSNYISMSDELKKRTIYEDLARGLVDQFIENPSLVMTQKEVNPLYDSTIYQTVIRIVPFKED